MIEEIVRPAHAAQPLMLGQRGKKSVGARVLRIDLDGFGEEAAREYQEAVRLDPSSPMAWDYLSWALAYQQPPDLAGAEKASRESLRLGFSTMSAYYHLGRVLLLQKRYDEAIAAFERSSSMPFWVRAYLAACHALSGRDERARDYAAQVVDLAPAFSIARFARKEPFKNPADLQRLIDGLRRAGMPE